MIHQNPDHPWRALRGCRVVATLVLLGTEVPAVHGAERLRVTPDGRWLERADGTPFFYLGDTAWLLLQRLNRDETERYLVYRAAKAFSVVQASVLNSEEGRDLPNARTSRARSTAVSRRVGSAHF